MARQRDSQTVEQFDARVRELAIDCDLNGSLKDRLNKQMINGVKDALKKKLLFRSKTISPIFLRKRAQLNKYFRDVRSARLGDIFTSEVHYVQQSRAPKNLSTRQQTSFSRMPNTQLNSANTSSKCSRQTT